MKIKFSKIAALLFAGVVFLAPGCTDYQSDIEDIYDKIGTLADQASVATLKQQADGLQTELTALKAAHDADIIKLNGDIDKLTKANEDLEKLMKANDDKLAADIAALGTDLKKTSDALAALSKDVKTYYDEFNALKQQVAAVLPTLATKEELNAKAENLQNQINTLNTTVSKEIQDRAAADNALDAKIAGEEAARKAADEKINKAIDELKKEVTDFKAEFVDFKSLVNGEISGLKTRVSTAEAAIKKINEEIIPAVEKAIADCNERVDSTVEELDAYKMITDNNISVMKDAIKALREADVTINERIDSLDAKFDDYVLTTTFETYKTIVDQKLAAKVDTATFGQYVRSNDAINKTQNDRIEAAEKYIASLKNEILPALEDADKALNCRIDTLTTKVGDIKKTVDGLVADVDTLKSQMAQAMKDIDSLKTEQGKLAESQKDLEAKMAALLNLIQSVVFVPDFDDCCATINYAVIEQGFGKLPIFEDAESVLNYKVYPESAAEELLEIAAAEGGLDFFAMDVVPVERRGWFKAEGAPGLEIIKIEASERTKGGIAVTVKGQNINDFYTTEQQYSSCFVIDYTDAEAAQSILTSGYNNWARNPLMVSLVGIADVDETTGKIIDLTDEDLNKEIPYTDTTVVKFLENAEAIFAYNGKEYTAAQLAEETGIVIPVDYAIESREFNTENSSVIALFVDNDVITEEPVAEMPAVEEQLDPATDASDRKAAIDTKETITVTATVGGKTVDVVCTLLVTKEQAYATAKDLVINWGYKEDVAQDALAFNGEDYSYSRDSLVVEIADSNFDEKGVELGDFDKSQLDSIVIFKINAEGDSLDVTETFVENIKIEVNADNKPYISIENFEWDVTYAIEAFYELPYCTITVNGNIVTIDREREAITLEYEPYEITYVKDLKAAAFYKIPFADSVWTKLPYACTIADNVTAEYFVKDNLQDNKPVDIKADHQRLNELYTPSDKPDTLVLRSWFTHKDATEPGIVVVNYTFFTYYGQEIDVIAPVKFVAPALDLRHNIYRVFDAEHPGEYSAECDYYSQVEPYWNPNKEKIEYFDVMMVDLPSAFVIVDEDKANAEEYAKEIGVEKWFAFEEGYPEAGTEKINMSDRDGKVMDVDSADVRGPWQIYYHGWDDFVGVDGGLVIINTDGSTFSFETTFDEEHVAIYDESLVGPYADYRVYKYDPIKDFKVEGQLVIAVDNATWYYGYPYKYVTLTDKRDFDLLEDGLFVIGDDLNGFVNGVSADEAYGLTEGVSYKIISDDVDEDIINAIHLEKDEETNTPVLKFDYTQQLELTHPVELEITVSFKHDWTKEPMTATIPVIIKHV